MDFEDAQWFAQNLGNNVYYDDELSMDQEVDSLAKSVTIGESSFSEDYTFSSNSVQRGILVENVKSWIIYTIALFK